MITPPEAIHLPQCTVQRPSPHKTVLQIGPREGQLRQLGKNHPSWVPVYIKTKTFYITEANAIPPSALYNLYHFNTWKSSLPHWTTVYHWSRTSSIHPSDHPRCPGNSLLGRVLRILQRANMHSVKLNNLKYKLGNFTKEDDFSGNVRPFGVSVHFVACVY